MIYPVLKKLCLITCACMFGAVACSKPAEISMPAGQKQAVNLKETKLALIPEKQVLAAVTFSPDGRRVIYAAKDEKTQFVIDGGRQGPHYDIIKIIIFSPDGKRSAYVAGQGGKEFIVVDGREGKKYDSVSNPVFSPDGRYVAYEAGLNKKYLIVFGDRESAVYDMTFMPPVFSPDSTRIFYILQDYEKKKATNFISDVQTGRVVKSRTYDSIGSVAFSSDGSAFAFSAVSGKQSFIVRGDFKSGADASYTEGPPFDFAGNVSLSANGAVVVYVAEKEEKQFLITGKQETPLGTNSVIYPPAISPDGSKIAYVAADGTRPFVVIDGKKGQMYDDISPVVFSPDGAGVAFAAMRGADSFMVVNGKEGPAFEKVLLPVFSPDGSHIAYRAKKDNQRFVVTMDAEGKKVKQHPPYEAVWEPVFSPDGKYVAYGVGTLPVKELWWKVEPVE